MVRATLFSALAAAAWAGLLLPLAGALWKAARGKPCGAFAALSLLYGAAMLRAKPPSGLGDELRRLTWALSVGRWRVGGQTVSVGGVLAAGWLATACVLLARELRRHIRAARSVRRYAVPADERTQGLLREIAGDGKGRFAVTACTLPGIAAPYAFGLLNRRILLPETAYTDAELSGVLRHEYAHFRNHDLWLRQLARLLGAVYWWNPAAHWLGRELERAAELRCDAAATKDMDRREKAAYLRALLRTLKGTAPAPESGAISDRDGAISERDGAVLRERFAAVMTDGRGGRLDLCGTEQGGEIMAKRSWLYLTRKYKRSVLLLLLLFAVSFSISVGLCVWRNINAVTAEIEQTLGTGFRIKVPSFFRSDPAYSVEMPGADGEPTLAYAGPKLNDTIVEEIAKLDGVARHNAELDSYVLLEDGKLFPGLFTWAYEHYDQIVHERDEREENEFQTRVTMVYGNTDTSLADAFRTGSFTLAEGRHIRESDAWKVLISDKLAEINGLRVGDSITVSQRAVLSGLEDFKKLYGEMKPLEIVGVFHVNGLQPETTWVAETDSTYNFLLTDLTTALYFEELRVEAQYANYRPDILYENLTFFVDDPKRLDEVMAAVRALDTIDVSRLDFTADDTMYHSTVGPLRSIRNLIVGLVAAIVAGCAAVLCIIFTMWVRGRRQEIAVYLSMGFGKAAVLGQLLLEAALIAVAAGTLSFAACQKVPDWIGNELLTSAIESAQPQEREITREEIHEAVAAGTIDQLYRYESADYAGPERIHFTFRFTDFLLLLALELLIVAGAVCKGGAFLFTLQPRQILAEFR